MSGKKSTRTEILTSGRMKAIDQNRASSGQAQRRVEQCSEPVDRLGGGVPSRVIDSKVTE
ncbi:hypothetical protein KGQ19_22445 [Catenulispora sp. NL8]|uniref:Uncharacterized protein n=1 Tax=Catenulispora pinistramenti TaxID=2705254 RepID=A0ABS5KU96_9ACTN|nr:hypothetical protein [Catenulispora pinistramenti]MBS2549628.1 hypothetical protein [Catenulispora pinistramenti]